MTTQVDDRKTDVPARCYPPQVVGGCPRRQSSALPSTRTITALGRHIAAILKHQGVSHPEEFAHQLAPHIAASEIDRRDREAFLSDAVGQPPSDILHWIARARDAGDLAEALWCAFLAGHFGRMSAESDVQAESAGRLYCGFGENPSLTWRRASNDIPKLGRWLETHQLDLLGLAFGNHRKFARLKGRQPSEMCRVIGSYVEWVDGYGGGNPVAAFSVTALDPESRFDLLFKRLSTGPRKVFWMGRTGAFDLLDLLAEMGLIVAKPCSPYLQDATGPWTGAELLWGARPVDVLDKLAAELAHELGVPIQAVEDALCNWQKGRRRS